jgi:hypothetical protein
VDPILLASDTSFWDIVWYMIIMFFWVMVIWMFIAVFADIFRRSDMSGIAKAAWIFLIIILPFLGVLIYMIARPSVTESDIAMQQQMKRAAGYSSADDIAKAQALLQSGAITQAEFEQLKQRALA